MHIAHSILPSRPAPARVSAAKKKERGGAVAVVVGRCLVSSWDRALLGIEKESGAACCIRLTQRGVNAHQFQPGQLLVCRRVADALEFEAVAS